ncbi:hypothetical protein P280DRAFT_519140 [Massarina eburnea CBS 473.64]|uniref:Uncharacterized protein n=1 Tax=Massarina eburnea CBS 473.64 TaxID=1395130 RepID=A0A6A6RX69_9PLEO|nr:hypothetical protein P280DRAFT_519140 [Massarina eburnea CBS 473.64]
MSSPPSNSPNSSPNFSGIQTALSETRSFLLNAKVTIHNLQYQSLTHQRQLDALTANMGQEVSDLKSKLFDSEQENNKLYERTKRLEKKIEDLKEKGPLCPRCRIVLDNRAIEEAAKKDKDQDESDGENQDGFVPSEMADDWVLV